MTPSHPFPALYDGTCAAGCEFRVHPGDSIIRDDDGTIWHEGCAPAQPVQEPVEVICPDCRQTRPCPCIE